jgi:uncharacterized protein (TIGR02453 family)
MAFRGWPVEAIEFYEGLEADNSKAYWHEHKSVYDAVVKGPMDELLGELAEEFGPGRVFRPNRDIRFSADKSPYKTAIAANIGGDNYLQFSARGLGAGSGMWMMAPDQLDRYRRAVDDDGTGRALERLIEVARRADLEITGHDRLKTAPKGYPRDHPRVELLRHKGVIAWKEWPAGAWLGKASATRRIVDLFRAARPLNEWLAAWVGESHESHPTGATSTSR